MDFCNNKNQLKKVFLWYDEQLVYYIIMQSVVATTSAHILPDFVIPDKYLFCPLSTDIMYPNMLCLSLEILYFSTLLWNKKCFGQTMFEKH